MVVIRPDDAAAGVVRRSVDEVTDATRTRPRLPRKADQIFQAALVELAELGYDAVTIESIAVRSGVNKTTIYRWWKSKDELLSAALRHGELLELDVPDTGSLREDLVQTLAQVAALLDSPFTRAIIAGAVDGSRPGLAPLATEFVVDRLAGHERILEAARQRGEIGSDTTATQVFHPLIGALWIRVLLLRETVDGPAIGELVDSLLPGLSRGIA